MHVGPDHGLQPVFFADVQDSLQVTAHDGLGVLVAEAVEVAAQAHAEGLVHTQVDLLAAVGGGGSLDHLLQQLVGLRQVRQDHVVLVPQVGEGGPVEDHLQVAQGLDAGAQLDAEHGSIIIQGLQLLIGVAAPLVAEEGPAGDLVGVLGVHHAQVQAHQGHFAEEEAHGVGIHHAVAGAVEHGTGGFEIGLFMDITLGQGHGDQAQGPVKFHISAPGQVHGAAVADHGKNVMPEIFASYSVLIFIAPQTNIRAESESHSYAPPFR